MILYIYSYSRWPNAAQGSRLYDTIHAGGRFAFKIMIPGPDLPDQFKDIRSKSAVLQAENAVFMRFVSLVWDPTSLFMRY